MHVKYAALFPHQGNRFTHFLSLDKCLKNRSCLQVLNFEQSQINCSAHEAVRIELDRTWLSVLKLTARMQNENRSYYKLDNNNTKILDSKLVNSLLT